MSKRDTKREMSLSRWNKISSNKRSSRSELRLLDQPMVYQIRIRGHLGRKWKDWFEGLTIKLEANGETLLTGTVVDQAALHGILKKVRDLGMPLLSVNSVGAGRPETSELNP
jgi:hypothetical protein